ncbi:superoxide dismutase family protein [Sphingomicrobium flavum]|uniref:superoxide dismutase family protein n=1 Tax=Sphingomicrobium flavum TaxID=1229164 RepID=UPI0021AD7FFC|nr:superoxide dismutase family protein [Sphingomicrobium flavum]
MRSTISLFALAALLSACTNDSAGNAEDAGEGAADTAERSLTLKNSDGADVGSVSLRQEPSGIMLAVNVAGLEPGAKAVHLHETGDCSAGDFTSAGGHWNPEGKSHGRDNPQGAHLGDLANLQVGEDGSGESRYLVTGVSLSGSAPMIDDEDGTALVIHAGADDYKSDPAGDAGDRVACVVVSTAG